MLRNNLKVGVLRGGISPEREISLLSGENVIRALRSKGYNVVDIDITSSDREYIENLLASYNIDIAFITLHGEFGEDGGIQKILEEKGLPFTGSGSYASYLAMDKIATRRLLEKEGILIPEYWVVDEGLISFGEEDFPLVVKPHYAGSSLGVSLAKDLESLKDAIKKAEGFSSRVIVERFIKGRELTVGILGNRALPVIEIDSKGDFFNFNCKYEDGMAEFIIPANLPSDIYSLVQKTALKVHESLGCEGFSRVDFRIDESLNFYVLELNSIPGLTSHSLLPQAASKIGIGFADLCEEILRLSLKDVQANSF